MNFNNHQELIDDIREWATNDEISYRNWIQPTIILSAGQDLSYFDRISEWQEIIPSVAARYFSCMGLPMSVNQVELVLTDEDVEDLANGLYDDYEEEFEETRAQYHPDRYPDDAERFGIGTGE